jgi:hypothetical protein
MKLKYIVVGTGRCGTVFMARYLTSLGIPCGHESVFDWHGLSKAQKIFDNDYLPHLSYVSTMSFEKGKWIPEPNWLDDVSKIEAESSYMSAPFLLHPILENVSIIHVVRDPAKVVHSFCHHIDYFKSDSPNNPYEGFIYKHLPELSKKMSHYDRASLFYVVWNELIEKSNASFFYRIEDDPQTIADFLQKDSKEAFSNKKTNSISRWSDQTFQTYLIESSEIRQRFIDLGRRYGYRMNAVFI